MRTSCPAPSLLAFACLALGASACAEPVSDGPRTGGPGDDGADDTGGGDTGALEVEGCHATPRSASEHTLWLAFPYDAGGGQADTWRSFRYDEAGLEETGSAEPGRAWSGRGAWTPDGAFPFLVDDQGRVHGPANTLTEPYTQSVTVDRSGEILWLVNPNWAESGGGVYRADIDCETGELGTAELVWSAKNASVLALRPGRATEAAVVAKELDGVAGLVHHVDLATGAVLSRSTAFGEGSTGDTAAIVSDAAWDHEGERLLVADNSEFSGVDTRVAILDEDGPLQVIEVPDPVSLQTAPWPDASAVVISGYDDAVFELAREGEGYTLAGHVASPALPGSAAGVARGALRGRVLVSENAGIWELELLEGGGVEDHGRLLSGSGYEDIPGALALQP